MTNHNVVVSDTKSGIGMAMTVAVANSALFSPVVQMPQATLSGGYISISRKKLLKKLETSGRGARISAWVDSMRASSPTHCSASENEHHSWTALGFKGKMITKQNYKEKVMMKKTFAMHEESSTRRKVDDDVLEGAVPAYMLDHENTTRAKVFLEKLYPKLLTMLELPGAHIGDGPREITSDSDHLDMFASSGIHEDKSTFGGQR